MLLGALGQKFVKANQPDAVDNFETIVMEYIKNHNHGQEDFSNLSGVLLYYQSSQQERTFGQLYDIVVSVCKTLPRRPAQLIR